MSLSVAFKKHPDTNKTMTKTRKCLMFLFFLYSFFGREWRELKIGRKQEPNQYDNLFPKEGHVIFFRRYTRPPGLVYLPSLLGIFLARRKLLSRKILRNPASLDRISRPNHRLTMTV